MDFANGKVEHVIFLLMDFFQIKAKLQITPNSREIELFEIIKEIICDALSGNTFELETDTSLEFIYPYKPNSPNYVEEIQALMPEELAEDTHFDEEPCTSEEVGIVDLEYKEKAVAYWKSGKIKHLSLGTVQKKFRKVKSIDQLYRWNNALQKGGTQREKILYISKYVFNRFEEAVSTRAIIHDIDLRCWALEAKAEVNIDNFQASKKWLYNFKQAHNIVSRKICKFVARSFSENVIDVENIARNFVSQVCLHIPNCGVENIYNADECGFNLEIHSGRTLAVKGVKLVEANVQSINATTHSYTILPAVSATGKLLSPLLIVLKEQGGTFGTRVLSNLFSPKNVKIEASSSGKLTSQIFKDWFVNVFLPNTNSESMLLLDSWTGHCPEALKQGMPANKLVNILTIPKKTTGIIQPLDVYGFRFWKGMAKSFSDLVILSGYDVELRLRNNIIKLQSIIHNQLCAPRFQNLFKYAWFKSGYINERPEKTDHPVSFVFVRQSATVMPTCVNCETLADFRCSWCTQHFCFQHFFIEFHFHDEA